MADSSGRAPAVAPCAICGGVGYLIGRDGEHARARACTCQEKCGICGGNRFVIEREADGYDVAKPCVCTQILERVRCYNEATIPGAYADKHVASFNDRATESLKRAKYCMMRYQQAVDVSTADGLVLLGGPGVGKTHLVVGLLAHLTLERAIPCRFVDFYQLCARLRSTFGGNGEETESSIIEPLVSVPVLVLDDLGKGQGSAWELTVIDQIVTRRYNAGRIILATSNYLPEDELERRGHDAAKDRRRGGRYEPSLEERIDQRLVSRLRQNCEFLILDGVSDFRSLPRKGA
ncbi:MAG: ATP-binding protein [Myxococcota bacterium]